MPWAERSPSEVSANMPAAERSLSEDSANISSVDTCPPVSAGMPTAKRPTVVSANIPGTGRPPSEVIANIQVPREGSYSRPLVNNIRQRVNYLPNEN